MSGESAESDDATADGFGDVIAACHARAITAAGCVVRTFRLAGRIVRIEFAGPGLIEAMTAAFAPSRVDDDGIVPDLTVRVFDTATTGVPVPPPPWSWDSFTPSGQIIGFGSASTRLAFQLSAGAMNVHRPAEQTAWYWTPSPARITAHDAGAPFLFLLHWWLADEGLQVVHGAGVGGTDAETGGGVLLVGAGGAGKSSTALACVAVGARYVGDDYCALDMTDGPVMHRLFATAKADEAAQARLVDLPHDRIEPPASGSRKAVFDLAAHHGERIVDCLRIDAIVLPEVVGGPTSSILPATQAEALRALGPSTMTQLPGTGADSWRLMSRLAAGVPAFHLRLGTDVRGVADAVAEAAAAGLR